MVELGSKVFWERLASDPKKLAAEVCMVDTVDLEKTLQRQSSLHAWVNAAHESARIELERMKWEETKARARALLIAKESKDPNTEKAKIAEVLKAEVEIDPAVIAATEAVFTADRNRGGLRAMSSALEDRLQMLIQLSAKQRQEMRD